MSNTSFHKELSNAENAIKLESSELRLLASAFRRTGNTSVAEKLEDAAKSIDFNIDSIVDSFIKNQKESLERSKAENVNILASMLSSSFS